MGWHAGVAKRITGRRVMFNRSSLGSIKSMQRVPNSSDLGHSIAVDHPPPVSPRMRRQGNAASWS